MPFTENLAPFFSPSEFGSEATLNGAAVNGILDRDYNEPLGNMVQAYAPTFMCSAAAVPAVAQGQSLVCAGVTYKVRGVEPDGVGVVLLRLEAQ